MRILVIADKIPSSRLGDGLRLFGLLQPLAGHHRFGLLCFARPGDTIEPQAEALFESIQTLPFPTPGERTLVARATNAFRLSNFRVSSTQMRSTIAQAIASKRYDLMLELSGNMLLTLPPGSLEVPLVVDSIDAPILRDLRALRHAPPARWPRLFRQLVMFWRYERAALGAASMNIYASEEDTRLYARVFPGRAVATIPNGVDIDFFTPQPWVERDGGLIVFEGNMMFPPNIDAAQRLCREVLPLVLARHPDARVRLVGRDPPPELRALASPNVEVTGTVPDVRPELARAAVFACPMRLGSGIKNKILQAWAMGLPVVATPESLGGLAARDGINLLVRESPKEFAEAVISLLDNRDRATRLGAAGRETAEKQYSWQRRSAEFESLLQRVLQRRG